MTAAKTPRTQPSEVRRRDLLEAAATLFLQQGFDATPVDEIVLRAGMSKGLFYHYFSSKQEILAALREQFLQQFHDRVHGALEQAPEPVLRLSVPLKVDARSGDNWEAAH